LKEGYPALSKRPIAIAESMDRSSGAVLRERLESILRT